MVRKVLLKSIRAAGRTGRVKQCGLCGSRAIPAIMTGMSDRQFGIEGTFSILRCNRCGLLQTSPQAPKSMMQEYYPSGYSTHVRPVSGDIGFMRRAATRFVFAMLSDFQPKQSSLAAALYRIGRVRGFTERWNVHFFPRVTNGLRVFDVGCGDGIFARWLADLGMSVTGCEIDSVAAGRAKICGISVQEGDFELVPVSSGSYDIVAMIHVLEHFHDPVRMVAKAFSMLKAGGRLIVVVPNCGALSRHIFGEHWFNWDVPRHLFHFSADTLRRCCEKAGFRTSAIETRSHASVWIDSARAILGLNPLHDFGLPAFNRAQKKVHNELCAMLNDLSQGDHLAACFLKPS